MKLRLFGRAIIIKFSQSVKRHRGLFRAYVSLFIVMTLFLGGTLAWLTSKSSIDVSSPIFEMRAANGLQDDTSHSLPPREISVENFRLEEASSVDGRNIYFPSTFKNNVSDANNATITMRNLPNSSDNNKIIDFNTTNQSMDEQTSAMTFREGNAGDKMIRYAYADTDIPSTNGQPTDVWIKGYKVIIGDSEHQSVYQDELKLTYDGNKPTGQVFPEDYSCPVRIAIIDDSGHTPKVFDPSARLKDYANDTKAVYNIDMEGQPDTKITKLDSFSSYYYGTDNPLFTIEAGKSINLTVVAWLEGTHPRAKDYIGKELTFEIQIETNITAVDEIYLHDWTVGDEHGAFAKDQVASACTWSNGKWLSGDVHIAMSYYDTIGGTYKTVIMTKQESLDFNGCTVYKAAIPNYVDTKISFYRLSKNDDEVFPGTVYNSWHTYEGVNDNVKESIKGWRVLGNLAETRNIGTTTSTYDHYYALRGNGYGNVPHHNKNIPDDINSNDYKTDKRYGDSEKRYQRWLSPCIGYWGSASGPADRS